MSGKRPDLSKRNRSNARHGMSASRTYNIWRLIKYRCESPASKDWDNYGGRGIGVCIRWLQFENFLEDMGNPPTSKHQIDRVDNNGDYEPENCRWCLPKENSRHSRWAKLSMEKAKSIRSIYAEGGCSHRDLAKMFGVKKAAITRVLNYQTWA